MSSDCFRGAGVVALSLALQLSACSVKEDRQACPCFLTLDFSGVDRQELARQGLETMEVLVTDGDGSADYQAWELSERVDEYGVPVSRSGVDIMVVSKDGGRCDADSGLAIEEGEECPVIYMSSGHYVFDADEAGLAVTLHKNYCVITVHIKSSYGIPERPFMIEVDGEVDGYSPDGAPREGPFHSLSAPSLDGLCSIKVPRQRDSSLWLVVDFLDSSEIRTFPIGEYIAESGYDWTAEDLENISVEMDFSRTGVETAISKWKKTLSFDITF